MANRLGRDMWAYPGERVEGRNHLVLGLGAGAEEDPVPEDRSALIAYGPLLSDDGAAWLGTAALVCAPSADAAREVLTAGSYASVEVHAWEFGGRR